MHCYVLYRCVCSGEKVWWGWLEIGTYQELRALNVSIFRHQLFGIIIFNCKRCAITLPCFPGVQTFFGIAKLTGMCKIWPAGGYRYQYQSVEL
jgi:hypothetical protein